MLIAVVNPEKRAPLIRHPEAATVKQVPAELFVKVTPGKNSISIFALEIVIVELMVSLLTTKIREPGTTAASAKASASVE